MKGIGWSLSRFWMHDEYEDDRGHKWYKEVPGIIVCFGVGKKTK